MGVIFENTPCGLNKLITSYRHDGGECSSRAPLYKHERCSLITYKGFRGPRPATMRRVIESVFHGNFLQYRKFVEN